MLRIAAMIATLTLATLAGHGAMAQNFFTAEEIRKVSPRASPELVQTLVENQKMLADAGIDTRLRVSHFLAQVMTETGGLGRLDENMNYSAAGLVKTFSRKVVTPEKASQIERQPQVVANWVYRNRLGNGGPETSDGWAYRGSGYLQLTGRTNYRLRGEAIGMPLEQKPDLARQPVPGLSAGIAYWTARRINLAADLSDRDGIRRLVNGGTNGLDESKIWHNLIWTKIYRDRGPFPNESAIEGAVIESDEDIALSDADALENILIREGFLEPGAVESGGETAVTDALRAYQESQGLEPTGEMDEDTFYAIVDPANWRNTDEVELASFAPDTDADLGASFDLTGAAQEASPPIARDPVMGSGVTGNDQLDIDQTTALSGADGAYSAYETAEGRYDGGNFIPHTVIGLDTRQAVPDTTAFPARAIVQILFRKREGLGQNLCTGTMIGPDIVLTAGHCVHGGTTMGRWYTDYEIFPGRNTASTPFGTCKATRLYALRGWTSAVSVGDSRLYDLGAIRLDCRIGDRTGWFGIAPLPDSAFGQDSTVQGYAADKPPAGRQWTSLDEFRVIESEKAFYQNDTFGGTSGSPVFTGTDYHITCVHTNGLHGSGNWARFNACTRVTPERLATIVGWIEEETP